MQEIEVLKDEEKRRLEHDDLYAAEEVSAEIVDYLKVTEDELVPVPQPSSRRQRRAARQRSGRAPKLLRLAAVAALVWLVFAAGSAGLLAGNWWALFLLLPIVKNFQAVREDRRTGEINRQTKRAMSGMIFASLFMVMFLTGAWNLMWPLLLIGWGVSQVMYRKWQDELYV